MEYETSLKERLLIVKKTIKKNPTINEKPASNTYSPKDINNFSPSNTNKDTKFAQINLSKKFKSPQNHQKSEPNYSKKLKKLKKIFHDLYLQIENEAEKLSEKRKKIKNLEAKCESNQDNIKKIKQTVKLHQEKIIRFEGLMHEIEFSKLAENKPKKLLSPYRSPKKNMKKIFLAELKQKSSIPSRSKF